MESTLKKESKTMEIFKKHWAKISFIFLGITSTIWFLIRVIPKPSRAAYPCMRAAAPVMSSFVLWLISIAGMWAAYRKAKSNFLRYNYLISGAFVVIFVFFLFTFFSQNVENVYAKIYSENSKPLSPTGTAKGIFPGRVAWVYNPNAALWTGAGNYWEASVNPQAEYDKTFTAGIELLSGSKGDKDSWDKLFQWFNNSHQRPNTGYVVGDKIAIKINQNNSADPANGPADNTSNANPQSCVACVRSLVNAGVPESDIWIGDPSRAVTDNVFNAIHMAFPNVNVVDFYGNNGRVKTSTVADVFPNQNVVTGQSKCFYDARYIINMPLLKGHVGQGITFGSKNFYGINGILPHWQDNGRHPEDDALTKYMTNPNFGGKTILWAMDAMYPNRDLEGVPSTKWDDAPFNGKPASSFIMSLDGVAEESVSLDFFYQHYADEINANGGLSRAEAYLHAASMENAGVHEHWNNNTDRKYSRNLDPKANGIELVYTLVTK